MENRRREKGNRLEKEGNEAGMRKEMEQGKEKKRKRRGKKNIEWGRGLIREGEEEKEMQGNR